MEPTERMFLKKGKCSDKKHNVSFSKFSSLNMYLYFPLLMTYIFIFLINQHDGSKIYYSKTEWNAAWFFYFSKVLHFNLRGSQSSLWLNLAVSYLTVSVLVACHYQKVRNISNMCILRFTFGLSNIDHTTCAYFRAQTCRMTLSMKC